MTLPCITVRQPFAGLLAAGIKPVENRSQAYNSRGELAIHAGKTVDAEALERAELNFPAAPLTALGAVLAVGVVAGCHPADTSVPGRTCCEPWGQRLHGDRPAFHIQLTNVR